ncbi:acyl-CoA dehydrogenase family protein [Psychrobacillus sp. MER TA 171]|uniref:acyl-CoA dehydrogenase family protein n=1 Tax=Psychrobacillus sp. MER TA 171 TaxID=2939577 RepID=UPI00203F036C|nr:acyl-CoA dehydrogenase family protein [Psychrobacillus sp. MER TA 171]MCM3358036.1 acyl-CoA dehydrogenase family protein [Psychrobacillus sp. MER TA 171]
MEKQLVHVQNLFSLEKETHANLFTPEDFTEEDHLIAKTTESFIKQDVIPHLSQFEQHNYATTSELFKKAGDLGLLSIEVPESYGGLSLNKKTAGLVAEKMGQSGSFSVSFNIHVGVGTLPYVYFGTAEQKEKYLPKLASGQWIGAYALTEPSAGSDALSLKTTANLQNDGTWLLNGEKQWITNAKVADVFVVFAKTVDGVTAFIVEKSLQGVSTGPEEKKMGIKGSSTATLILDNVSVPSENMLGVRGKGHQVALNILNMARLKLAFANIGTAKQATQLSIQYVNERKQFNKHLSNFTMIQEKIANMVISIYGAESAAYRTAHCIDEALESIESDQEIPALLANFAIECALNKINSSEILDEIVDEAVQIHGGNGFMQEYPVESLYRDARISRIFEGTNEINRLTIAKLILKKQQELISTVPLVGSESPSSSNRNFRYIVLSLELLHDVLKAFSETTLNLEREQEYLRLLADMTKDIYVMESSYLRLEKYINNKESNKEETIHQLVTGIICEEGYRKIETAAITILTSLEIDEQLQVVMLQQIKKLSVPLYSNLFIKKRKIAEVMIKHGRYFI